MICASPGEVHAMVVFIRPTPRLTQTIESAHKTYVFVTVALLPWVYRVLNMASRNAKLATPATGLMGSNVLSTVLSATQRLTMRSWSQRPWQIVYAL